MARGLTFDQCLEMLRTTVSRLDEMTHDVPESHLYGVTDYGWSVNDQLAHLRECHDVLGGSMLRIIREDRPTFTAGWPKDSGYFDESFHPAMDAFRGQRDELLGTLEPLTPEGWERTATVLVPPGRQYERDVLYYGDWMARHERSHLRHMARILQEPAGGPGRTGRVS